MGRKQTPGLVKRKEVWHIDKLYRGRRICESTGTGDLAQAQEVLARRLDEARKACLFGVRPQRMFRLAATKYLNEATKDTLDDDAMHLKQLNAYIGNQPLDQVYMETLQPFIAALRKQGVKTRTINHALQVVRHILFLAAKEWRDEYGLTWLATAPGIRFLPERDRRDPYPLSWDEQERLFAALPAHLASMALFKVNTGCREQEVCRLQWEWEVVVPELETSVFLIPAMYVKNRLKRLVVLNAVAKGVIEAQRGRHPQYVFSYRGHPVQKINSHAWRRARTEADVPLARVHDLKHTFGARLRAAGVSFEDRQDLLGHKSRRITDHYSAAELSQLIEAANQVCGEKSRKSPALVLVKSAARKKVAVSA